MQRPASIRISVTWRSATSSERWIRTKPAPAHSSSRVASGTRIRWGAAGRVQPGVVAVRLDVGHVGAVDEPGHAAELDGDLHLVGRRGSRSPPSITRRTASASRSSRTGLRT